MIGWDSAARREACDSCPDYGEMAWGQDAPATEWEGLGAGCPQPRWGLEGCLKFQSGGKFLEVFLVGAVEKVFLFGGG